MINRYSNTPPPSAPSPVAPRSISLGDRQDGALVEVKEGERITIECYVRDARPAPSVAWYRSGLKLDSGECHLLGLRWGASESETKSKSSPQSA